MADLNLSQFPPAGPLTGAELLGIMQNGVTKQTTVGVVNSSVPSALPLGSRALSIKSASFTNTVAQAPLIANYQFGSAAVAAPGVIPIRNLVDLAANFNAYEDFTGTTSINSEIERFQPFNSTNHVFNPANMTLQVVNPNNDWQCTAVTQLSGLTSFANGVPIPIASLGLADTSTLLGVGQLCAAQGGGGTGGTYMVASFVPNVSVTFTALQGSSQVSTPTGLLFWMPILGVPLSQPYNTGGTTMTFASLPAFVTNKMALAVNASPLSNQTLNRSADWRVTNVAGNVITFSPAMVGLPNLAAGQIIWFLPVVTSGQIWSNVNQLPIDLTNPQTFFAIEFDLTLFNSVATRTAVAVNGMLTLAQFNAIPNTTPLGGWPAGWSFSGDDGNASGETGSAAEIDFIEIEYGCTQDCAYLNSGAVTYTGAATIMGKSDSGWTFQSAFGIFIAPPSIGTFSGRNKFRFIFANGMEYRFFNDVLYKVRQFQWNSQHPLQFAVDMAAGGMTPALAMNTVFPNNPAGFANMQTSVNSIKVWYQAPGN